METLRVILGVGLIIMEYIPVAVACDGGCKCGVGVGGRIIMAILFHPLTIISGNCSR